MKKRFWILAGAALAVGLAAGCSQSPAPGGAGGKKKDRGPVPVRTAFVERRDLSETMLFTGELEAPLAVEVKPKIQGRLEKMELADGRPTTEGAAVRQGEVIARLDDRELKAQVALAQAQAQQAEVTVAERERERKRLEALYAQAVATEQARDTAVAAHESARAALAQAQAQLQLAQVNLDEACVRAPMDGVVAARYADPGAMVGPAAAIVQIVQMDPLRLMLAVPARLLPLLTEGQTRVAVATDVFQMFRETGVDGVMIGRPALGNPWLFRDIREAAAGRAPRLPEVDEVRAMICEHLRREMDLMARRGKRELKLGAELTACLVLRPHLVRYLRGFRGFGALARTLEERVDAATLLKRVDEVLATGRKGAEEHSEHRIQDSE